MDPPALQRDSTLQLYWRCFQEMELAERGWQS